MIITTSLVLFIPNPINTKRAGVGFYLRREGLNLGNLAHVSPLYFLASHGTVPKGLLESLDMGHACYI